MSVVRNEVSTTFDGERSANKPDKINDDYEKANVALASSHCCSIIVGNEKG